MEEALVRVREYTLADAMPHLAQPWASGHGDSDTACPFSDAEAAFAAAGSKDKTLHVFSAGEGGSHTSTPTTRTPPGSSSSTGSPGASAPCPRRPPDTTGRRGQAAVGSACLRPHVRLERGCRAEHVQLTGRT